MDSKPAENGDVSAKADDDPSGRPLEVAASDAGVEDSFFDLSLYDHARDRVARLLQPEASSRFDRWSEVPGLLLGMPTAERLRLSEFMRDKLTSSVTVHPHEVWTRQHFIEHAQQEERKPGTQLIVSGIDGILDEPSWVARFGINGTSLQVLNFEHHQGSAPTMPSCVAQKLRYLLRVFKAKLETGDHRPLDIRLRANDPDQDVATTVAVTKHLAAILALPDDQLFEVTEYLAIQDLLDRYAAMVPVNPESPQLKWNAYINEAYSTARRDSLFNLPPNPSAADREWSAYVMSDIIRETVARFGAFVGGERQSRAISTDVHPLHDEQDWCLVDESDPRNGEWLGVGALHRGKQLLVKVRPARGRYVYSYNLADPQFVSADQKPLDVHLPSLLADLQALDPATSYGGSLRCGGCRAGTDVPPEQMVKNLERCLRQHKASGF